MDVVVDLLAVVGAITLLVVATVGGLVFKMGKDFE
jgi:uncharacterized membrane-anchored protein